MRDAQVRQCGGLKAGDAHGLESGRLPCSDLNSASRDSKSAREEPHKLFIGRAIDGRSSNTYSERAIVLANDLTSRGPRYYLHLKDYPIAAFGIGDHYQNVGPGA